jgi:hypothetical protein
MWDWCAFCIVQKCETLNPKPQPSFCAIWTIFSLICAGPEGDSALGLGFIIILWNARQCPQKKGDVVQGVQKVELLENAPDIWVQRDSPCRCCTQEYQDQMYNKYASFSHVLPCQSAVVSQKEKT